MFFIASTGGIDCVQILRPDMMGTKMLLAAGSRDHLIYLWRKRNMDESVRSMREYISTELDGHRVSIGCGWMDGWVDGWVCGWMDVWMDGWMDGWIAGCLGGSVDGWMGGWVVEWLGGWMDGWMAGWLGGSVDGWTDGWMDE